MIVTKNLISPRNGEPLIAATQDFLTGAYLLTQKDVFLTKDEFCRLVAYLSDASIQIDMIPPAIVKPRMLWTGKQVVSMLVRPNKNFNTLVNLESEEKFYTKRDKHFCEQDGFVAFRRGELLCGNLGKKTLGADSKSGLFYVLIHDYGYLEATLCMSRLAKLCARYLGERGFSIGINDVTPSTEMLNLKRSILSDGQHKTEHQIDAYKTGRIRLKPGCDALQSLESDVNGILGQIREKIGNEALVALNIRNAPLCMAQCGSKGSTINISQMIACLGQQSVGGSRIQNGFVNRTLPHFPILSLSPAAKGFVGNSFYSGLTATEFFFHTMGGREGLVDTAVKTAETGYMARRLMKALEDLSMQYDNTVRNSEKMVIQFSYGDDGLDPALMEKGDRPVDYSRLTINVCSTLQDESEDTLHSSEVKSLVTDMLQSQKFQDLLPQGQKYLDETREFFYNIARDLKVIETLEISTNITLDDRTETNRSLDNSYLKSLNTLRTKLTNLSKTEREIWSQKSQLTGSPEYAELHRILRNNVLRLTRTQFLTILESSYNKYTRSMIVPGESVGAVGAQSLAEPSTQMTLKTFHFAGVASMNVTLGKS
jgi:DNA-directed RNA polymerase III subunit RPC1